MMIPLIILALGATLAGWIPFGEFVSSDGVSLPTHFHLQFSIAPVALGLLGIGIAFYLYKNQSNKASSLANTLSGFYTAAYHKFYVDELYIFITKNILFNVVGRPAAWFDKHVVDGMVNATGSTTQLIAEKIKGLQSGKMQDYAIYFLGGALALAACAIYLWK
jgi:NADH-quinone oxidoreductase subunit L